MTEDRPGLLRRALSRFTSPSQEASAAEQRAESTGPVATPIAELAERDRATVAGTLRTVTLRPRAGVPALVAELSDGSGTMALVWLGRRTIPGIEPGRPVLASGRICREEGRPTMFNPRYELRPAAGEGAGTRG